MEKLSDATEALHKGNPNHRKSTTISSEGSSSEEHPPGLAGSSQESPPDVPSSPSKEHPSVLPENSLQGGREKNGTTSLSGQGSELAGSLPVPAKKAALPPIRSPKQTLADAKGADGSTLAGPSAANKAPLHKNVVARRRKNKLGTVNEVPDTYEQQLKTYVDSIKDDASPASSSDTNLSSGGEHSDHMLGASVFSRHASKAHSKIPKQSPAKPSLTNGDNGVPASPLSVGEGSLAIGPNARELFTTGTTMVEKENKRGKTRLQARTEIVPVGTEPCTHTPHPEARGQVVHSGQSKVCLIL